MENNFETKENVVNREKNVNGKIANENFSRERIVYNTRKIKSLILLITITITLMIAEVYAWMNTQKNVQLNNLTARVEVAEGLQISLDAEKWSQEIVLGQATKSDDYVTSVTPDWTAYDLGIGTVEIDDDTTVTSNNIRPKLTETELAPGVDETAQSGYIVPLSSSGVFLSDKMKLFSGSYQGYKLSKMKQVNETEDVDESCQDGYYAFDIYLMNTTKPGIDENQLQLNFDSIAQEIMSSTDTDYGLKNSIRVAFALYDDTAEINDNKKTVIEKTYESEIKQVAIWEPNADKHSSYVIDQNQRLKEIIEALDEDENAKTYAVSQIPTTPVANEISNVYSTTDSADLAEQKTLQTSGDTETRKLNGVDVIANKTGTLNITDISGTDFNLGANTISKVRVYIWLEGQDVDCVNWSSHSKGIDLNVGLVKDQNIWTQFRDGTTAKVTNGSVTLEVGSAITGYEVTVGDTTLGDGNWCVLGAESGHLLISTKSNVKTYQLGQSGNVAECQNDWVTAVSQLDSTVSGYANSTYADSVRSINADDINRVTGYDPETAGCGAGQVWEYENEVTYTKNSSDGYIYYQGSKQPTTLTKNTYNITAFTYYNGSGWITLGSGESSPAIKSNNYYYYPNTLGTSSSGTTIGISNDSDAYTMLFANTEVTGSSGSYNYTKCYWLGSQYVYTGAGGAVFGLRGVGGGSVGSSIWYDSDGHTDGGVLGVRPAVSLKSDIQVSSTGVISN